MQLYFIRHGQSENNALWDRTGASHGRHHDPELTPTGHQQVQILAEFLGHQNHISEPKPFDMQNVSGFGITHLYTSLMVRAIQTAIPISHALGLPVLAWEDIHEGGGIYITDEKTGEPTGLPGNNRAFFEKRFPELILPASLGEGGWWNRPFEARAQRPLRARRVRDELLRRHGGKDDRVAVISHGGFYNHFLNVLLGTSTDNGHWFILNNTAITRIDFREDGCGLVYQNRVDFLPRELIT